MSRFTDLNSAELLGVLRTVLLTPEDRLRLISHPRMPLQGLLELSPHGPKLFVEHPVVRLVLATDSSFFDRIPESVQIYMLKRGAGIGPGTIQRVACCRSAPIEIRIAGASSPVITEELARQFIRHAASVRVALSANTAVPLSILDRLAGDRDVRVRTRLAARKDLTEELYERLAQDEKALVLWTLACNRACARHVLAEFMESPYPPIRVRAARSLRVPPGVIPLRELVEDSLRI
jgi:hypothetical protein